MDRNGAKLTDHVADPLPYYMKKKLLLFYWSASWCGPCRQFTPKLVDYYNNAATNAGGRDRMIWDVIFISVDKSEDKMFAYMKQHHMEWYTIQFDRRRSTGIKQYAVGGIPRLMLVRPQTGEILQVGQSAARIFSQFKQELNSLLSSNGGPSQKHWPTQPLLPPPQHLCPDSEDQAQHQGNSSNKSWKQPSYVRSDALMSPYIR